MLLLFSSIAAAEICSTTHDCGNGRYCAKSDSNCEGPGVCLPKPRACVADYIPVCGCDDALYYNRCEAMFFGVSVHNEGECTPDERDAPEVQLCDYVLTNFRINKGNQIGSRFTYSDETFNAYLADGTPVGHLVLRDKKVFQVGCEVQQTPTYNVYVKDLQTVRDVFNAADKIDMFDDKLSDGSIRIEGQRFTKKVKGGMTRAMVKIISWFR
ncbi:hypothetical protein KY362_06780 [Candidatus Woesearchaeota archaeon]|nr:hypothetical protein [Candidatus Woesearchaeota archaeon]